MRQRLNLMLSFCVDWFDMAGWSAGWRAGRVIAASRKALPLFY